MKVDTGLLVSSPVDARPDADPAAHNEAVQHALVAPGPADARVHPGPAGHLGVLERRHETQSTGSRLWGFVPLDQVLGAVRWHLAPRQRR
ncbi:MAG TPA: hypothetical protein VHY31_12110 [Streptosporangiaceae bacterium]|jgi:hypothetical protein|nr:hypothetical protein [Streptosporangiaceae bacterium]